MLNEAIQLQIWDTAGENQADLLDSLFWGNAAGAIIVCNLLQADCVSALKFWQDKLHQAKSKGLLECIISCIFTLPECIISCIFILLECIPACMCHHVNLDKGKESKL